LKRKNGNKPLKKLLIVDDDPNIPDMVHQLLEDGDYQIAAAPDGLVALDMIKENKPDAVLLDLMMPRLDGFGLIEKIKNDPALNNLPVIVLTAKTLNDKDKEALKESARRVIQKQGLTSSTLLEELEKTFNNSDQGKQE
jgi:CheY-like chemotaxis protein